MTFYSSTGFRLLSVRGAAATNYRERSEEMAAHKDPVCGMQVDEASAAGSSEHDGRRYYFCNAGCKEKFDQDPQRYAGGATQAEKS